MTEVWRTFRSLTAPDARLETIVGYGFMALLQRIECTKDPSRY